MSRNYPEAEELLRKFNSGLAKLRSNGTYLKILTKYQMSAEGK